MILLLVDLGLGVLAVLALALAGITLYRAVKALLRRAGRVSELIAGAANGLAVVTPTPTTGAAVLPTRARGPGPLPRNGARKRR